MATIIIFKAAKKREILRERERKREIERRERSRERDLLSQMGS